jgi:hypothetical protein
MRREREEKTYKQTWLKGLENSYQDSGKLFFFGELDIWIN